MAASADIYSMIRPQAQQPGPLDNYGAMMQLRAMGDASQLHGLQRQQLERSIAEDDATSEAYKQSGGVRERLMALLAERGLHKQANAAEKAGLDIDKSRGEIAKNDAEVRLKKWELGDKIHGDNLRDLQGANDQAGWDAMRTSVFERLARQNGPDQATQAVAKIPAQFSPQAKEQLLATGVKTSEYLTMMKPDIKEVTDGQKKFFVDVNPRSNPGIKDLKVQLVASPDAQLSAQTTRRGQDQPIYDHQRGVYVTRPGAATPGAKPAQADGAPGAAAPAAPSVIKPTGLPAAQGDVHELRKEFNALPEVKAYRDIVPVVESARSAPDTRAGDIQLGYAVGKILDPNSVVREGEIKMVGDAAPIYEKYKGEFDSIANGTGRFTPETRKQLVAMLDNAVKQRGASYQQAETTYKGIAEKNGIPVDQVIITPMAHNAKPATPAPGAKMFDKMPDAAQYSGRRMRADDGTIYVSDGKVWKRQAR